MNKIILQLEYNSNHLLSMAQMLDIALTCDIRKYKKLLDILEDTLKSVPEISEIIGNNPIPERVENAKYIIKRLKEYYPIFCQKSKELKELTTSLEEMTKFTAHMKKSMVDIMQEKKE